MIYYHNMGPMPPHVVSTITLSLEMLAESVREEYPYQLSYGFYHSPAGKVLLVWWKETCIGLYFVTAHIQESDVIEMAHKDFPKIPLKLQDKYSTDIFGGQLFNTPHKTIALVGTPFQTTVWNELLQVPFGQTATYNDIAHNIGEPKSARAVGNAIGQNKISFFIPCHRVIRSDGALGGYRFGLSKKAFLLNIEAGNKKYSVEAGRCDLVDDDAVVQQSRITPEHSDHID